jgi:hypothetical protein
MKFDSFIGNFLTGIAGGIVAILGFAGIEYIMKEKHKNNIVSSCNQTSSQVDRTTETQILTENLPVEIVFNYPMEKRLVRHEILSGVLRGSTVVLNIVPTEWEQEEILRRGVRRASKKQFPNVPNAELNSTVEEEKSTNQGDNSVPNAIQENNNLVNKPTDEEHSTHSTSNLPNTDLVNQSVNEEHSTSNIPNTHNTDQINHLVLLIAQLKHQSNEDV